MDCRTIGFVFAMLLLSGCVLARDVSDDIADTDIDTATSLDSDSSEQEGTESIREPASGGTTERDTCGAIPNALKNCTEFTGPWQIGIPATAFTEATTIWAWLFTDECGNCMSLVSFIYRPGTISRITLEDDALIVWNNLHTGHYFQNGFEISVSNMQLEIRDGLLTGIGTADYSIRSFCEHDDNQCFPIERGTFSITVSPAGSTTFGAIPEILPWEHQHIRSAWPISSLYGMIIETPQQWTGQTWISPNFHGPFDLGNHGFQIWYSGDWALIRGQTITFGVPSWLFDLSGTLFDPRDITFRVHDIGPPVRLQEMTSSSEVATFGDVTFEERDDCGSGSCAVLRTAVCHENPWIAGQMDIEGASKVVVTMKEPLPIRYSRVEVNLINGGSLIGELAESTPLRRVYDISLNSRYDTRIGYEIRLIWYCSFDKSEELWVDSVHVE